jgi:hypothetical protein
MTDYATHRFSVGQQVMRSGETVEVTAQIEGLQGPEYRIASRNSEAVVGERELTYRTGPAPSAGERPAFVVH